MSEAKIFTVVEGGSVLPFWVVNPQGMTIATFRSRERALAVAEVCNTSLLR